MVSLGDIWLGVIAFALMVTGIWLAYGSTSEIPDEEENKSGGE